MPNAYDAYLQSQSASQQQSTGRSPFNVFQSQETPYQSVSDAAMSSASAKQGATLDQGRHEAYGNYLKGVIGGTISPTEGDARAAYIPHWQGNTGYRGSNYVDQNTAMSLGAIPAAYEYAGIAQTPFEYGVGQLQWGGPTSTKRSAKDFLDTNSINRQRSQAEDALRRAIVPEYMREDVSQGLADKWTEGWTPEFNRLKGERAAQQSQWWGGSDWANKSINPGGIEVLTPEQQRLIRPESSIYHDATRELVTPEQQRTLAEAKRVWHDPVMELLSPESQRLVEAERQVWQEGGRELVTPESQRQVTTPEAWARNEAAWNQYVSGLDANMIFPGQDRHFYYKSLTDMNGGNTVRPGTYPTGTYNKDGLRWTVQGDGEEVLHDRSLAALGNFYQSLDPRTVMQSQQPVRTEHIFRSGTDYSSDWGAKAGYDLWIQAGNSAASYQNYMNDPNGPEFNPYQIDYQYELPLSLWNYTPAGTQTETVPAEYRDVPGGYQTLPAVYETVPAQYRESRAGYYEDFPAVNVTDPAVYRDVPAYNEIVPPVYQTIPAVTRLNPASQRQGFQTVIDPITGVAIPNWYLSGSVGSNSDLAAAYGSNVPWYMR